MAKHRKARRNPGTKVPPLVWLAAGGAALWWFFGVKPTPASGAVARGYTGDTLPG